MRGWGWWVVSVSLAGCSEVGSEPGAKRDADRPEFLVRIPHAATADTVRRALEGAAGRLESDRCRAVFRDFVDLEGRPLQEALDRTGLSPSSYLGQILFYDGSRHRLCRSGRVLAVASPGTRVVQVCPEAIRARHRREPRYVEAILIHEALHTLGLAENPPTSFQITTQVLARCTR